MPHHGQGKAALPQELPVAACEWTATLLCRKCGRTGVARMSDNGTFAVDERTAGFAIRTLGGTSASTEIVCDTCHEIAVR